MLFLHYFGQEPESNPIGKGKAKIMNPPEFSLAYSPCPNDTFLFYHLTQGNLTNDFRISEVLMDVEELNQSAIEGKYDITKLSYSAYFEVQEKYELLQSGSALGRNCGPILIYPLLKPPPSPLKNCKILSPGRMTTAHLLLDIYLQYLDFDLQSIQIQNVRYDKIIPELEKGNADMGLVIHEERFTYTSRGMGSYIDLGEWWERETQSPIPLGCIAIKRELSEGWKVKIENKIRESLDLAWSNSQVPKNYILEHSQNKDPIIVQAHIDLYVNEFTRDLGDEGNRAIQELANRYTSSKCK